MKRPHPTITVASAAGHRSGMVLAVEGERLLVRRIQGQALTVVPYTWWRRWPRETWWRLRQPARRIRHAWWDLLDRIQGIPEDEW